MNNKLTLTDAELIIEMLGLDKLWSFTGSITVPWGMFAALPMTPA